MNRTLMLGIASGALALVLAGGAVYARPSLVATTQSTSPTAQPSPTTQPGSAGPALRAPRGKPALLVGALVKAAADVTQTQPKDVLAALRGGKSLAQYAQDHGKTANDVVQAARKSVQDRLSQAVSNGKLTQERADAMLKQFDDSASNAMNNTNLGQPVRRAIAKRNPVASGLVKATADVTQTQPKDVLAALQQGQSLAQYAQAHGKTADDILAKLREQGQQRLDKALDRAKDLIQQPGLGRGGQPNTTSPTAQP